VLIAGHVRTEREAAHPNNRMNLQNTIFYSTRSATILNNFPMSFYCLALILIISNKRQSKVEEQTSAMRFEPLVQFWIDV
jgi:hypothetical protein